MPAHDVDPAHHHGGGDQGPERGAHPDDHGECDAGQDPVGEGITEECHAPKHHPGPDHRRGDDGEQAGQQGALHEHVGGERLDPPGPGIGEELHGGGAMPSG